MRNIISITVSADHRVCCPEWDIARTGENECTRFEITLAEELSTYSAYIDFEKPDGKKFKTPRMNIENNRIIYDLPSAVLDVKGNLLVHLVLQNDEGEIWKSNVQKFYVSESVDATETIVEKDDFVADIEKRVKELNDGLKNKVDKDGATNRIYGTDNNGNQTVYIQTSGAATKYTIPLRNANGEIITGKATRNDSAVTLEQLNDGLNKKLNKSNEPQKIYGTDLTGNIYMRDFSWHPDHSDLFSQPIVQYGPEGQIEVDALILNSPNGTQYKLTVADDGTLNTAKVD